MYVEISLFVIYVEAIIYFLLYSLHGYTLKNYRNIFLFYCLPISVLHIHIILVLMFKNFPMFQCRSDFPQANRNLISSITNILFELPHEQSNNLAPLRKLENQKNLKFGWRLTLAPGLPSKNKTLAIQYGKVRKKDLNLCFVRIVLSGIGI